MKLRRKWTLLAAVTLLAGGAWLLLRPHASHDSRLAGVWQDSRLEAQRQQARDSGPLAGQGSWLALESGGQGRQVDYNRVTLQTETPFLWRTEEVAGRRYFYRSYEAAGAGAGEAGRSGEVRYAWELSADGKRLTLKGEMGQTPAEYERVAELPERIRQSAGH